jgi:cytochrome oxidase Cu insertion factor (SCO1/SenC/PrrC family)
LDGKNRSRAKLIALLSFLALPVVAATLAYRYWEPRSFSNYGDFLPPTPLPDVTLVTTEGQKFRPRDLLGQWSLWTIDSGNCDQRCEAKLYKMRQLRLTQGKNRDRIARVWLITDSATPSTELAHDYAGTWFLRANGEMASHFPSVTRVEDHIYLVDNKGNLMMRYPKDADASRMVKDLSRLLHLSGG